MQACICVAHRKKAFLLNGIVGYVLTMQHIPLNIVCLGIRPVMLGQAMPGSERYLKPESSQAFSPTGGLSEGNAGELGRRRISLPRRLGGNQACPSHRP
jgi:hypothetical protein